MSMPKTKRVYGKVTQFERIKVVGTILQIPFVLGYTTLTKSFTKHNSSKTWGRVLSEAVIRHLVCNLNCAQLQFLSNESSFDLYKNWTRKMNLSPIVEEIAEGARLLWMGQKRTDRVLLFCHGGAFALPLQKSYLDFLKYLQGELEAREISIGIAILNYTLVPDGVFPIQLKQISAALSHLLASGIRPENLQLMGGSAGANLILQLISHILHPLEGVPPVSFQGRLRGAYLMSLWAPLTIDPKLDSGSHPAYGADITSFERLHEFGQLVLSNISTAQLPYADAVQTSDDWFKGVDQVVERFFVTAGELEYLKEGILIVGDKLKKHHGNVEVVVQKNGVHEEPLNDFLTGGGKKRTVGDLTPVAVLWLASGYSGRV